MNARYARQMILPEVGTDGQALFEKARVLVVGAGGLGCAVLQYLGAAGCGQLRIVDHDRVEESNLHRQPLYRMSDVGAAKATAARGALLALNPNLHIEALTTRLTAASAAALVQDCDLVVDAADTFAVTYTLSDTCQRTRQPLVSASVLGFNGYVGAFCGGGPSYRAVFPELPQRAGTCAQNGVLGSAVGVIGTLQAQLVLSLILRSTPTVLGQLVSVDLKRLRFGNLRFDHAEEPDTALRFVDCSQLTAQDFLIDVRSEAEIAAAPLATSWQVSTETLTTQLNDIPRNRRVVLCCHSGVRAWRAARILENQGFSDLALVALG
jgi:molybdopterin/thiamine biosynthesis adenylyltransferase